MVEISFPRFLAEPMDAFYRQPLEQIKRVSCRSVGYFRKLLKSLILHFPTDSTACPFIDSFDYGVSDTIFILFE